MKQILLLLIFFAFCFAKCNKDKIEQNGLPSATHEGKNTLGFMLNGEPWTPQGFNGTSNLSLYYDATFSGGVFNLSAYKVLSKSPSKWQVLTLFGDSIQKPEKIILPNKNKFGFSFTNDDVKCFYDSFDTSTTIIGGYFDIQKLDKANNIFAGEFEIKFTKTSCSEVQISHGRFDMKF